MLFKAKKHIFLLVVATLIMITMTYHFTSEIFYTKSYDYMTKLTSYSRTPSNDIVLVMIDDKSLMQIGRWPWKRMKYADVFDFLKYHTNAKVWGFDAVIVAPDYENSKDDNAYYNAVKKYDRLVSGIIFDKNAYSAPELEEFYDTELALKSGVTVKDLRTGSAKKSSEFKSYTQSPEKYIKNSKNLASVTAFLDNDGYVRKAPVLIDYKGKLMPSLPLSLYAKYTGITEFTLDNRFLSGQNSKYKLKMPIHHKDGMVYAYINYYSLRKDSKYYSHNVISASDLILSIQAIKEGKKPIIDPEIFNNKIVIVGANANAQGMEDVRRTPISDIFAGPDIHGTLINNMLDNKFMLNVSWQYNLLLMFSLFLFIFIVVAVFPVATALGLSASAMFLFYLGAIFLYSKGIAINFIAPELFMIIAIAIGYSYRYLNEGLKKAQIERAMGKYISKDVMQNVMDNIENLSVGGKKADVSILFIDIRGFTSISERLSALEVSDILNKYFQELVPIIDKHKGIMNKFIGDAMLAVFGEPIKSENHALNAVLCANEMLSTVKRLQVKWLDEGKPKIDVGIGIASGEVFIGNIGTEDRLEYTVIGDTVNTASRIENFNKVYKTKFLISESTFERVQKYVDVLKIREVQIRGKVKKINIYEVLRVLI